MEDKQKKSEWVIVWLLRYTISTRNDRMQYSGMETIRAKIKTRRALRRVVGEIRQTGKKIVAISGSMDLLHAGHVYALLEAKKQGDVLVVFVNSDASVQRYKGPSRPIVPEGERAFQIAALACVDYVVLFDELTPRSVIEEVEPHVYCNSSEWGKECIESAAVKRYGGRIHIIRRTGGPSTTELLRRIEQSLKEKDVRAIFFDRDGTLNDNTQGYIHRKEDFVFLPGVLKALTKLSRTPYLLFIITNQSGVGRGYYPEDAVTRLHAWLVRELQKYHITITKIYYCPHHPEEGCGCRKPGTELLTRAVTEYGINMSKSFMIGDRESDIVAGREMNMQTIRVGKGVPAKGEVRAQYTVSDLREAADVILQKS